MICFSSQFQRFRPGVLGPVLWTWHGTHGRGILFTLWCQESNDRDKKVLGPQCLCQGQHPGTHTLPAGSTAQQQQGADIWSVTHEPLENIPDPNYSTSQNVLFKLVPPTYLHTRWFTLECLDMWCPWFNNSNNSNSISFSKPLPSPKSLTPGTRM